MDLDLDLAGFWLRLDPGSILLWFDLDSAGFRLGFRTFARFCEDSCIATTGERLEREADIPGTS